MALQIKLYDADSDVLIQEIQDGDIIQANTLPTQNLNIAAFVLDNIPVESMIIYLNNQYIRTENIEPYALFGDSNSDFNGGSIPLGSNTITFEMYDQNQGNGQLLDTVTVDFTILDNSGNNNTPNAVDDSVTTPEDTPVTTTVLANDNDVDGDILTITAVSNGASGTTTVNADSTITYIPDANFYGTDSYNYTISDGQGGSDTATVTVTISPVNDSPIAVDDSVTTLRDTPVTTTVLANDNDVDGDILTITAVSNGTHGTATVNADSTITYTPDANFYGTDSYTYTISDGQGDTDTATVDILIDPSGTTLDLQVGLYDADSDVLIQEIQDGDIIQASTLPTQNLNIAVFVLDNIPVESMIFYLNDQYIRTENIEPYALFGDSNSDFNGGSIPLGSNTITFEMYDQNQANGQLLDTATFDFTIA